ncbi:MAG: hypothetical protein M1821_002419 [Bathelium mastoideum]|nr:MAG: hypothetical protein M1821_002419 [Bathelium mastoideum]
MSASEPDKLQAWQAADANDALAESLRWYNLARWGGNDTCPDNDPSLGNCSNQPVDILPDEDNYIQAIQTLWSSDQSIECTMTESACQTIECEQGKYPCNYLITNSFVNFANLLRSQYNSLQQAQPEVSASMPSFADTFAPVVIDNTADTTKDLLDGFASAFGVFSAFSWNKILKDIPFFKKRGNDHGWMKGEIFSKLRKAKFEIQECYLPIIEDTTNSLVSTGVTTAKDQVSRVTAQLGNQNNLSQLASQWTDALLDTMEPFLDNMQNGSLTSNQALNSTLFNGVFMELGEGPTYEDMRDSALQVLYSQLLIPAWRLVAGAENLGPIYPAILQQPGTCNQSNPFGNGAGSAKNRRADVPPQPPTPDFWAMSDQDADISRVCLDNSDNAGLNTFYLIATTYGGGTSKSAQPTLTHALPGINSIIRPDNNFGGITSAIIVNSSVMGYQLNNNANGYFMPENSMVIDGAGTEGEYVFQNQLNTPGWFSVPICSADDIFDAIFHIDPSQNNCNNQWPCCG